MANCSCPLFRKCFWAVVLVKTQEPYIYLFITKNIRAIYCMFARFVSKKKRTTVIQVRDNFNLKLYFVWTITWVCDSHFIYIPYLVWVVWYCKHISLSAAGWRYNTSMASVVYDGTTLHTTFFCFTSHRTKTASQLFSLRLDLDWLLQDFSHNRLPSCCDYINFIIGSNIYRHDTLLGTYIYAQMCNL